MGHENRTKSVWETRFIQILGFPLWLKEGKDFPNSRDPLIDRKWVPVKQFLPNLYQAKLRQVIHEFGVRSGKSQL